MGIEVRHELAAMLEEYARIPIAFDVNEVFDVTAGHNYQFTLAARTLPNSYVKDYDVVSEDPIEWPRRFDVSNWAFLGAFVDGERLGSATVAYDTPALDMLEGRIDLAVLWDIRVAPSARRRGVGTALFNAAATWATSQGCCQLKVETQNINVAACRFYARQGFRLRSVRKGVYRGLPEELQLLWYKDLACRATG